MEQTILRKFNTQRDPSNCEVVFGITYDALHSGRIEYLMHERIKRWQSGVTPGDVMRAFCPMGAVCIVIAARWR